MKVSDRENPGKIQKRELNKSPYKKKETKFQIKQKLSVVNRPVHCSFFFFCDFYMIC